eukprot:GHVU01204614.1.p2 GENE.GHVU01204614.1~~GHVU01204614.1.p2  ORF type:complete len:108 (-),score=13.15 GHVU01204614.1:774-1097(-)
MMRREAAVPAPPTGRTQHRIVGQAVKAAAAAAASNQSSGVRPAHGSWLGEAQQQPEPPSSAAAAYTRDRRPARRHRKKSDVKHAIVMHDSHTQTPMKATPVSIHTLH